MSSIGYPKLSAKITSFLRKGAFQALLCFDSYYFDKNHYVDISKVLSQDCENINDIGGSFFGITIAFFLSIVVSISIASSN